LAISHNLSDRLTQLATWLIEPRAPKKHRGPLLDSCRQYLLLVANQELHCHLQAKVGFSNLVQVTFLKAHRHFETIARTTEAELLAWLRRILLNSAFATGGPETHKTH
jgi:hypothetical protein